MNGIAGVRVGTHEQPFIRPDDARVSDALLVAYTNDTRGGVSHAVAKRLDNTGNLIDATAITVSGLLPGTTSAVGGFTEAATSFGTDFYVGWSTSSSYFFSYFGGRRIPATGSIGTSPEKLAEQTVFG